MQKISSFTQLIAWQKAHQLVLAAYKLIIKFPKTENYALSDQMRRCAVSISSNLLYGQRFSHRTAKSTLNC